MNRQEAIELLNSIEINDRLRAARYFSKNIQDADIEIISNALKKENVSWIINALSQNINGFKKKTKNLGKSDEIEEEREFSDQVYSIAVEDTTRQLIHEIEPILGTLRISIRDEVKDFSRSKSWHYLDRLEKLLSGISILSKTASSPKICQFNLAELIEEICRDEFEKSSLKYELVGKSPLMSFGDPDLIRIIFCNGIKNAIEATSCLLTDEEQKPIVVSWGDTDLDYWITVLDRGRGLPIGSQNIWKIGATTKKDHLGMGLPIAKQAAKSMRGTISISPREHTGVEFNFRWSRKNKGK